MKKKTAVLLCNLGSPDAPTPEATRRYLAQFLWDRRVVEIPRALWWLILNGIILRTRPAKSAAKYATVWTAEGSPLKVWTAKQAKLLQGLLGERGQAATVRHAMRYGQPAIAAELDQLANDGFERIVVLPAYPQYCAATTASVHDEVSRWALTRRVLPELVLAGQYHAEPLYIEALAQSVMKSWQTHGRGELLVMSFHGMPERTRKLGDPYADQCEATGELLARRLGLKEGEFIVTFQSRFGRAKWLEPYTEPTLVARAKAGLRRVDVICPGFSADCLETLEEIAIEARKAFLTAGGKDFTYIPALNDSEPGLRALVAVTERLL
ncbi:ferrochelatase [Burkholderiaceae bacterium UC74_6]